MDNFPTPRRPKTRILFLTSLEVDIVKNYKTLIVTDFKLI